MAFTAKKGLGQKDLALFEGEVFIHSTGKCSGAHVDSSKLWNMEKKQKSRVGEFHSPEMFHTNFIPHTQK